MGIYFQIKINFYFFIISNFLDLFILIDYYKLNQTELLGLKNNVKIS